MPKTKRKRKGRAIVNYSDIPEHRFTEAQIAALMKSLDPQSKLECSPNVNDAARIQGELEDACRWFTSNLVIENRPTARQELKKLERIVAAGKRLQVAAEDSDITGNLKFEIGDALAEDHKLRDLIDSVRELETIAANAAKRRANHIREGEQYKRDCAERGLPWSKPDRWAMRVLVHNLARLWLQVDGEPPPDSVSSAFMTFALKVIETMQALTTNVHRNAAPNIDRELAIDADSIRSHFRIIKKQAIAAHRAKAKSKIK